MNMRVPFSMRQYALGIGSLLTAAATFADPIGYATLNGGTTGGAGGEVVYASTGAEINQAMCNRASEDTPLIIYVSGTINHGNTQKFSGSCDTKEDEIQFKGVSNISLIGVGDGALFDEIGIHLRDTSNIILQNLHIRNVKKSGSPTSNGGDAIGMESDVFNVWVDHCTLEASGGEDDGYDSLLDMKATTQYVTVSYTYYHDSGRGGLMGSSDSDDSNTFVTFHHNRYENIDSRLPLLRHGTAHAFNNYYTGITKSGMNPRMGGEIKAEHNHFENSHNPIGTFYTDEMGYWDLKDNIFQNVTWASAADEFPAGPNPVSTTSISIPYSYQLDDVNCTKSIVMATAGAGKGLATSDGSCSVGPISSSSSSAPSSSAPASSSSSAPVSSSSSSAPIVGGTQTLQAENAYIDRGAVDNIHNGYTGAGFVDYENVAGSYVEWTVHGVPAGQATATFRFANGTTSNRAMSITVNGQVINSSLAFNGTGAWASWAEQTMTLPLNAGTNVIRATAVTSSGGPNLDSLVLTTAAASSAPASSASSAAPVSSSSSSTANQPGELGANLAAGAGADGSSKGGGTSYGNVTDGDQSSYWSPSSTSGQRIAVKGLSGSFNTVIIRELNNATTSWRLVNHDNGDVLASGSTLGSAGVITFASVSASKVSLMIDSANSAPQIAEFEVYNATGTVNPGSSASSASSVTPPSSSSAPASSSSSAPVSSSSSSAPNSSSSAANSSLPDYSGPISNDCINLATNPNVNWRDTSLQSDQEIVECLAQTLGQPVGYGENARGGYDPNGNSKLTVITKSGSTSVEQQIFDAITDNEPNWIVFDKFDFANPSEVAMYRLQCGNPAVQSHLGATESECVNYTQWCSKKGVSSSNCVSEFFNNALNEADLPIRNIVVGSNKTLDGRMSEAFFRFNGFAIGRDSSGQAIQTSNSVILTHLNFVGAGHTEDHGLDPDMIRATGESHDIWIHRNNFDTTGDAAFDVKVGAYDITISYNKLVDVKRASLHGSSDSRTINAQITTTMHHNAFITRDGSYDSLGNTLRRIPLIRRGTSHMFNNVFVNYRKDILSVRVGASVLWEDNAFVVNRVHQEKSSLESSLDELQANLADDVSGGSFRADRTYLWFADGACNIDGATQRQITNSSGSVSNLTQQYSSRSQNSIADWRFDAGQDLVDYVSATAGRYGVLPFNSPLAGDRYYVLGLGKVPCL